MKRGSLAFVALVLWGCETGSVITAYIPPQGEELVDVKLVALDQYRNSDSVRILLASQLSCDEAPRAEEIVELKTQGIFGDDIYEGTVQLPADRKLNILVLNRSSSGFVTTRCQRMQTYQLSSRRSYLIHVHNWSTADSNYSTFGCAFSVYRLDANGDPAEELPKLPPDGPVCE